MPEIMSTKKFIKENLSKIAADDCVRVGGPEPRDRFFCSSSYLRESAARSSGSSGGSSATGGKVYTSEKDAGRVSKGLTELSQLGTSEPVKCFGIRRGQ